MLKTIQIDDTSTTSQTDLNTANDAVINQTLEGHSDAVICVAWNETFQKLVSSDESGLTIVWGLQDNNMWCQEMIHCRKTSFVVDMQWASDGELICIAYNDGAVMVGSVEGTRAWGLELNVSLRCLSWSPDNRHVIFLAGENLICMYNKVGKHIKDTPYRDIDVIHQINWQRIMKGRDFPSLSITSVDGTVNLKNSIGHATPTIVNSGLHGGASLWNSDGSILAICGQKLSNSAQNTERYALLVKFFDCNGIYLHEVEVSQNEKLLNLNWEASGVKLAVATDRCIYFVSIRPSYKWAVLTPFSTLVYQSSKVRKT